MYGEEALKDRQCRNWFDMKNMSNVQVGESGSVRHLVPTVEVEILEENRSFEFSGYCFSRISHSVHKYILFSPMKKKKLRRPLLVPTLTGQPLLEFNHKK